MFDAPTDTWYLWLGVAATSVVALGVAVSLPTATGADAQRVAAAIDAVAGSPHEATGEYNLDAEAIRLGPHRLGLREAGVDTEATLRNGPIAPVSGAGDLRAVLRGGRPASRFDTASALERAAATARDRRRRWRSVDGPVRIRRINWGDVDVTLVGA
jgi:hypothetical protein